MKKSHAAWLLCTTLALNALQGSSFSFAASPEASDETTIENLPDQIGFTQVEENTPAFSYANVADVAQACLPSVVSITNVSVQQVQDFFFMRSYEYESESAGTGIILGKNDTELLLCTNHHVIENASEITVTFINDESVSGLLKGSDPSNDLAIVAVNLADIPSQTMQEIKIARTGSSDDMRIGEQVVAIGNALGYGQSVTTGIISAFDRTIAVSDGSYSSSKYENLIQTDAAINAGNSGGALLNMNGEVIGINSAKASRSGVEGMGYAIPISKAMPILEELMTKTTRAKLPEEKMGYLGVNGQSVSSEARRFYNIPAGIYITLVGENSPAQKAGLQESDILFSFDGEQLSSIRDLQKILQYYEAGETIDLGICRNDNGTYTQMTIPATLGDRQELQ